jgi:hypothetical protein
MSDLFAKDSREDLLRKLRAILTEQWEIECILADALGFQRGEADGPCPDAPVIGDHTAVTLAMQAARTLSERVALDDEFRDHLARALIDRHDREACAHVDAMFGDEDGCGGTGNPEPCGGCKDCTLAQAVHTDYSAEGFARYQSQADDLLACMRRAIDYRVQLQTAQAMLDRQLGKSYRQLPPPVG